MKTQKLSEDKRHEALHQLVDEKFLDMAPDEIDAKGIGYEQIVMEMFEVARGTLKSKVLRHLFNDDEFEPVIFPPEIHPLIENRDVFLMTIARKNDAWHVLWMSPPYF
jgi:hypothetical protein